MVRHGSIAPQNRPHCDGFGFRFGFGRALTTLTQAAPVIKLTQVSIINMKNDIIVMYVLLCVIIATYSCGSTVYPCSGTGSTVNLWSVGDSTDTADTLDTARTSDSSSGGPHPTPPPSTTTKLIDDMDATTMPESNVPLNIPIEPTTGGAKIITERTTEDFMNTEVESMTFEPIVDGSNGTVSGRAGSQSGVIYSRHHASRIFSDFSYDFHSNLCRPCNV